MQESIISRNARTGRGRIHPSRRGDLAPVDLPTPHPRSIGRLNGSRGDPRYIVAETCKSARSRTEVPFILSLLIVRASDRPLVGPGINGFRCLSRSVDPGFTLSPPPPHPPFLSLPSGRSSLSPSTPGVPPFHTGVLMPTYTYTAERESPQKGSIYLSVGEGGMEGGREGGVEGEKYAKRIAVGRDGRAGTPERFTYT